MFNFFSFLIALLINSIYNIITNFLIVIFAYFFILFFFVFFVNILFKKGFLLIKNFFLILKLKKKNLTFKEMLNLSKKKYYIFNKNLPFYNKKEYTNFTEKNISFLENPSVKFKLKKLKKKRNFLKNKTNYIKFYNKNKFLFFKKIGIAFGKKIPKLSNVYKTIFNLSKLLKSTKIKNLIFKIKLKHFIFFFFFLIINYFFLNIIFSLKFESTFLLFLFSFFVFLIYKFVANFISDYLNNDAFTFYNFLINELFLTKTNLLNLLNFQKITINNNTKIILKPLNLKLNLIILNLITLIFNNLEFINFLFFNFLINLITLKEKK